MQLLVLGNIFMHGLYNLEAKESLHLPLFHGLILLPRELSEDPSDLAISCGLAQFQSLGNEIRRVIDESSDRGLT